MVFLFLACFLGTEHGVRSYFLKSSCAALRCGEPGQPGGC